MLDLNQLSVFIRVVDEGSFTAAAKSLGMTKSRVSRMVAELEEALGVRLLQRTTRQLHLTEVGHAYYSSCSQSVKEVHEAHRMIADREASPQGILRIVAPVIAGSGLMGHYFARYQRLYPDVRIEATYTDRQFNLIQDGFDLGVYIGVQPDSSLISRTLTESNSVICASPAYLAEHGTPQVPADLTNLRSVKIGEGKQPLHLALTHKLTGEAVEVDVQTNMVTNLIAGAINSIVHGAGIGEVPYLLAGEEILSGHLIPLLRDWEIRPQPISLAYPSRQYLPKKVRLFIDFMVNELAQVDEIIKKLDTPEEQLSAFRAHLLKQ